MTHNLEPEESSNTHQLTSSMQDYLKRQGFAGVGALSVVHEHWSEVVGAELAQHVIPTAIREHELVVAIDHPAWATEVKFHARAIVQGLEKYVGAGIIKTLKVHVRP